MPEYISENESPVIRTAEEFYNALNLYAVAATDVYVATFGVPVGVLDTAREMSGIFTESARGFLDSLDSVRVQILIGLPPLIRCHVDCKNCRTNYENAWQRILHAAIHWSGFSWKYSRDSHMKAILFEKDGELVGGVSGGRNLSGSGWTDLDYHLTAPQAREALSAFHERFAAAREVSEQNIRKTMDEMLSD